MAATVAVGLLAVLGVATAAQANVASPTGTRHRSGILVLPLGDRTAPAATPEAVKQLLSDAIQLTDSSPADFSYPWIDPSGAVVVDDVTAHGRDLYDAWQKAKLSPTVAHRARTVKVSIA